MILHRQDIQEDVLNIFLTNSQRIREDDKKKMCPKSIDMTSSPLMLPHKPCNSCIERKKRTNSKEEGREYKRSEREYKRMICMIDKRMKRTTRRETTIILSILSTIEQFSSRLLFRRHLFSLPSLPLIHGMILSKNTCGPMRVVVVIRL
jgi:hypothetical protein